MNKNGGQRSRLGKLKHTATHHSSAKNLFKKKKKDLNMFTNQTRDKRFYLVVICKHSKSSVWS